MKLLFISWISIVCVTFSFAVAQAQDSSAANSSAPSSPKRYKNIQVRKTQEVSFEASEVEGAVRSPEGAYVNPSKSTKFMPLYNIEKQFDREIKDSVEYLQ